MHFSEPFFPSACPALEKKKKKKELEVQKNPILQRLKSSVWERENREGKEQDKKVYQIYTLKRISLCEPVRKKKLELRRVM